MTREEVDIIQKALDRMKGNYCTIYFPDCKKCKYGYVGVLDENCCKISGVEVNLDLYLDENLHELCE